MTQLDSTTMEPSDTASQIKPVDGGDITAESEPKEDDTHLSDDDDAELVAV